ncbi:hypothetical protein OBBRIDRAFT_871740 [Obba rivulosa]|uniref:DRBM domain-containing protein n=1 Tax=Obba rivulosa TaxID=1052685 RepID=A0A8E2AWV2_9APHY|nr:hypothetical protein OBBRIDRAFT_871740 [Obba rivulosa]
MIKATFGTCNCAKGKRLSDSRSWDEACGAATSTARLCNALTCQTGISRFRNGAEDTDIDLRSLALWDGIVVIQTTIPWQETSVDWRMQLNNLIQSRGESNVVSWSVDMCGPRHNPTWTATVYISGTVYGRSVGTNREAAKEEAARQALMILWRG